MSLGTLDSNRFRREAILVCNVSSDPQTYFASLRMVFDRNIESDASSWFTFDPATMLPTSHTAFRSIPPDDQAAFLAHEATADDVIRFVTVARTKPHVDRLVDATGGKPELSTRYRDFLEPNEFAHELRVAFVRDGLSWGGVALLRRAEGPPFGNHEVKALAGIVEFLGEGMRRALLTSKLAREEDGALAPGAIVLGPANRVDLVSPPAEDWLTGLGVELGDAWSTVLPGDVYAIASHARRTGAGHFDSGPAVTVAAGGAGDKVVLHAALMEHEPQGPVAVMIEPVRPTRMADEIVDAYRLSAEEADALGHVLRGLPPEAVEEHLAAALAKVGATGPDDLAATVYAEHVAPKLAAGNPVGTDGWFEDLPPGVPGDAVADDEGDVGGEQPEAE
ncbi:MAG: hypothetical protein QOE93_1240 [Actinomycetota bacterium]|nr:hypothetical protein [Actinomycetota bacterium]